MTTKNRTQGLFIASTGQHVGKTTTSLGIFSGLNKRHDRVGFIKPIGQEHVATQSGLHVDKDVLLFADYFNLTTPYHLMSPLLFPKGFTRDFLDDKLPLNHLSNTILTAFDQLTAHHSHLVVEGTGHVGVGSIAYLSNAQIAAMLGLKVILIASGGLGSTFDALALNKSLCDQHHVEIAGVILNRVLPHKQEMILHYMQKALDRWDVPILGCIPFDPFLSNPTMEDFELLFTTSLLSGERHHRRHFRHLHLGATSLDSFRQRILTQQLTITPVNREDIIQAILSKQLTAMSQNPQHDLELGLILTGLIPPTQQLVDSLKRAEIPMLYSPISSYRAMEMIISYTVKIRRGDTEKIEEAIHLTEQHIDFDQLEERSF